MAQDNVSMSSLQQQVDLLTRRIESLERWIAHHLDTHVQEAGQHAVNPWHYVMSPVREAIARDVPMVLGDNQHCHDEPTKQDKAV